MLRRTSRRLFHAEVSVALLLGALVHVAAAEGARAEDALASDSETAIFAKAAATGERVEIEDRRTETDTVYANPDGSMGRSIASSPVRFREDDEWVDIDLTLRKRQDGRIAPTAADGDVSFAGQGDGSAMTRVNTAGVTLTTDWLGDLPEPVLDGPVATYGDVLPDVDLRLTATAAGTTQVLVVKTREAAQNPDLRALELPVQVEGGSLDESHGGYVLRDRSDRVIGSSDQPLMWDSSGTVVSEGSEVPAGSEEAQSIRAEAPATGDQIDAVPLTVSDDAVALAPPATALTGEDVTYPVYIDPDITFGKTAWTMVFKENPNYESYKWTNSEGQGVGYQNYDGVSTKRLYWQFNVGKIAGARLSKAEFRTDLVRAASCDVTGVRAYKTGAISSSTNWSNMPSWPDSAILDTRNVDPCPTGKQIEWDVIDGVQPVVSARASRFTVGLRATSETNPRAWKRFDYRGSLYVTYSRYPNQASSVLANNKTCSSDKPLLFPRHSSVFGLKASVSDPDKHAVRAQFFIKKGKIPIGTAFGDRDTYSLLQTGWASADKPSVAYDDAAPAFKRWTNRTADEPIASSTFTMKVRALENTSLELTSREWTYCYITFDETQPEKPVINIDNRNRESLDWGVNIPVSVTTPSTDTKYVKWSINADDASKATQVAVSDKAASFTLSGWTSNTNRLRVGTNTLRVWSVDTAGNVSASPAESDLQVNDAAGMTQSTWSFDKDFGASTATDSGAAGRSAGLSVPSIVDTDGLAWTNGLWVDRGTLDAADDPHDVFLDFTGRTSVAATAASIFDPTAQKAAGSFTIAAYLDPTRKPDSSMTAVSYGTSGQNDRFRLGLARPAPGSDLDAESYYYTFSLWDPRSSEYRTVMSEEPADFDPGLDLVVGYWDPITQTIKIVVTAEDDPDPGASQGVSVTGENDPDLVPTWATTDRLSLSASSGSWAGRVDHVTIQAGVPLDGAGDRLRRQKSGRLVFSSCNILCP